MDNIINILTVVVSIITLFVSIFTFIIFYTKKSKVSNKELIKEFNESDKPGNQFVSLISNGYFKSVKTGNHGNSFPDKQNLVVFSEHLTKEVVAVWDSINVTSGECV